MPGPSFRDRKGHKPASKGGLKYPTGKTSKSGGAKTTTKPSKAYKPPVQRSGRKAHRYTPVGATSGAKRSRRVSGYSSIAYSGGGKRKYKPKVKVRGIGGKVREVSPAKAKKIERKVKRRKKAIRQDIRENAQAVKRYSQKVRKASRPDLSKLDFLDKVTVKAGKKFDLKPSHLAGQQEVESGRTIGGPTSSAGALGVSQFIPSTARTYGVKPGSSKSAVKSQVRGQAAYMKDLGATKNINDFLTATHGYLGAPSDDYKAGVVSGARAHKGLDRVSTKPSKKLKPAQKQLKKAAARLKQSTTKAKKAGLKKVKDKPLNAFREAAQKAKKGQPVTPGKNPQKQPRSRPTKPAKITQIGAKAEKKFGVTLGEGPGTPGGVPTSGHAANSLHYSGAAYDITGTPDQLMKTYNWLKKKYGSSLEELIYDPAGEAIFDGQVQSGAYGGHETHIHVAETTRAKKGLKGGGTALPGATGVTTTTSAAPAPSGAGGAVQSIMSGKAPAGMDPKTAAALGLSTSKKPKKRAKQSEAAEAAQSEEDQRRASILAMLSKDEELPDPLAGFNTHEESYDEYARKRR